MHPAALILCLGLAACPDPPAVDREVDADGRLDAELPETVGPLEVVPDSETEAEATTADDPDIEVTATECTPGADADCDDDNACTEDRCLGDGTCANTPNIDQCDDGDACTDFDRCSGGRCAGAAVDCDDGSPCTADACDGGACVYEPESGPCDDEDACTEGDRCEDGACAGSLVLCPGADSCHVASCEPRTGCALEGVADGVACEDGNACTSDTECRDGECRGVLRACGDGDPCTDDYCEPASGCRHRDNKAPCDDADRCTVDDRCDAGRCVGIAAGVCCADDIACDDGDACTVDRCEGPSCVHAPVDCDDGDACTRDVCEADVCGHLEWAPLPDEGQLIDDFEGLLEGWTVSSDNALVGWRTHTSWAASGAASLYCGDESGASYDHGKTLARAERTILVPPGEPTLHFEAKTEVDELGSCLYDALSVVVDGDVIGVVCGSGEGSQAFSLGAYEGREVTLALVFDTVDGLDNAGGGVWVDRLRLTASPCK